MKGGIACFMSALYRVNLAELNYSLGFLITSDEEGPSKDGTIKVVDEIGFIKDTPNRENLWAAQTPQGFSVSKLKKANTSKPSNIKLPKLKKVTEATV